MRTVAICGQGRIWLELLKFWSHPPDPWPKAGQGGMRCWRVAAWVRPPTSTASRLAAVLLPAACVVADQAAIRAIPAAVVASTSNVQYSSVTWPVRGQSGEGREEGPIQHFQSAIFQGLVTPCLCSVGGGRGSSGCPVSGLLWSILCGVFGMDSF